MRYARPFSKFVMRFHHFCEPVLPNGEEEEEAVGHLPQEGGKCSGSGLFRSEKVIAERDGQSLELTVHSEFRQDPLGVVAGSCGADIQRLRDPLGALALGDQPENISLPFG